MEKSQDYVILHNMIIKMEKEDELHEKVDGEANQVSRLREPLNLTFE